MTILMTITNSGSLPWILGLAAAFLAGLLLGLALGKRSGPVGGNRKRSRKPSRPSTRTSARNAEKSSNGDMVELYVGNLSYDMTEDQLRKAFEKYGKVHSARVIMHRFNKRSKGFGFIEMPDRAQAMAAIAGLNEQEILGRTLRVNEARGKTRPE